MSFFNNIVNKIAGRFKKAQDIGYDTIEEVDEAIDRSQPQVQPQMAKGLNPQQVTMVVTKAREFLELVDPVAPLDSVLPPLPSFFKNPQLMPYFVQTANYILKQEKGIDSDIVDELVGFLLGTETQPQEQIQEQPQQVELNENLKLQMANYARAIDVNSLDTIPSVDPSWLAENNIGLFQSVLKEILSTEKGLEEKDVEDTIRSIRPQQDASQVDQRLTGNVEGKLPETIKVRLSNGNIDQPDLFFKGMADLNDRLGDSYVVGERPRKKTVGKSKRQSMDRYPIKWNSPESQQFFDTFLKDSNDINISSLVGEVKKYLKSVNLESEIVGQDVDSMIWESINTVDNIGLGRTERLNPKTGESICLRDYLVDFFIKFPQYLPENISLEQVTANKKSWDIRTQLSPVMSSLISTKNEDVLNYILHGMSSRVANTINDRKEKNQMSYDKESGTGKAFKNILDDNGGRISELGSIVDKTSPEYQIAVDKQKWNSLQQYASTENGGAGNVLREVNDEIGKPITNLLNDKIDKISNGELAVVNPSKNVIKNNLIADTIQSLMLMGISQVDTLFKDNHTVSKDDIDPVTFKMRNKQKGVIENTEGLVNGKVFLNMDGSGIDKWSSLVNGGSLYNVMNDVAKTKAIISRIDLAQRGSDPRRIAQEATRQLDMQGITADRNPIIHSMLQDDGFISRSRAITAAELDAMNKQYAVPPPNADINTYKKYVKAFNNVVNISHDHFIEPAIETILNAENNIRQTYKDDPETMKNRLDRLDDMRSIFGNIFPTHAEYNWDQKTRDDKKKSREEDIKEWNAGEREKKPRRSLLGSSIINVGGQEYTVSQWWKALMGKKDEKGNIIYPLPKKSAPKESSQIINGLYKSGNSILTELIKSQQILEGFGLGEDVIKTINKVGDDYRNRIESLR